MNGQSQSHLSSVHADSLYTTRDANGNMSTQGLEGLVWVAALYSFVLVIIIWLIELVKYS